MQKTIPFKIIKEIEAELKNRKIKTSLFLIEKIKTIGRKYSRTKDPKIKNTFNYLTQNLSLMPLESLKKEISNKITTYKEIAYSTNQLRVLAAKIRNGTIMLVYGAPQNAITSAKIAKSNKINFSVITADSGPEKLGRNAAEELAKSNIKVEHVPDFMIDNAVKRADFVVFEGYAALKDSIIADIGADKLAALAKKHNIPSYCVMDIFSADRTGILKEGDFEEGNTKKESLTIVNKTKSTVKMSDITATITQLGILKS